MSFQYLRLKTHETLFLIILSLILILTRGSHITTFYSLPDASLALFLVGGIYLKNIRFFLALFLLGLVIDFGASAFDPKLGFCLTNGYWGLIPTYGVLWLSGYFLHHKKSIQKLSIFIPIVSIAIILAFIILIIIIGISDCNIIIALEVHQSPIPLSKLIFSNLESMLNPSISTFHL